MNIFPLHAADFYKTGHLRMYPEGTEYVYSNFTARSDKLANMLPDFDHKVVFFGLQATIKWLLQDLWDKEFFRKPKSVVVAQFKRRMDLALGSGAVGTSHIEALHDLGYLPLRIRALPEGSRVNIGVPLLTVVNTEPEFYWLVNYIESQLSACLWKPITTATIAYEYKRLLRRYESLTGAPKDFHLWQGHDFSLRGMSGIHDAAMSGAGHLLSFDGTDNIPAIDYVEEHYGVSVGGSVPATEHSVMCMGGAESEVETFRRLIQDLYPIGIISIVSDTWDFWKAITEYAVQLKPIIEDRAGKVVFRPDSGDPVKIVCGDPEAPEGSPARKGAIQCLWEVFGGTITATGHKQLSEKVGLIYGDSITLSRAAAILEGLHQQGFSSGNIVLGIGSYTYQYVTRDTFGFAYKSTWGQVNGEQRVLFKDPITDNGTKRSAKGLLRVDQVGDDFVLHDMQLPLAGRGELRMVFQDGKLLIDESLTTIRNRLSPNNV